MLIPSRRSAFIAMLAFASATPLLADDGQWSSRYWGLGWGDGYHAPPRTGGLHQHGLHQQGLLQHGQPGRQPNYFGSQPSGLMPGGYPYREQYVQSQDESQLPKWLWDPKEETVVVDTVDSGDPTPSDDGAPPLASPSANRPRDPSLGLPPSLAPTDRTDSRAMNRRGPIQARSNGWSR